MKVREAVLWYLAMVLFGYVTLALGLPATLPLLIGSKYATRLENGWSVTINASSPVEVLAQSEYAAEAPRLENKQGETVITLQPEIVPSNYAYKGTIQPGEYTLVGNRTDLQFSGSGFISFKNQDQEDYNRAEGYVAWISLSFMMALMMTALFFVARNEEKAKAAAALEEQVK